MPAAKPLTKQQLLRAMQHTKSIKAAAKFLQCSYPHAKYWFKKYKVDDNDPNSPTLFDSHKNPDGKGINKYYNSKRNNNVPIDKIISGEVSGYSINHKKIRDALIHGHYLAECCSKCGFDERRVTDYRIPLLLNFKDKNKHNFLIENLEFVCYNCYYLYIGEVFDDKQIEDIETAVGTERTLETEWDLDKETIDNFSKLGIWFDDIEDSEDDLIAKL